MLEFAFLVFALAPLFHFGNRAFLGTFSTVFAAIVLEALPFMPIGSVVSGLLGEFASQARIIKLLSKGGAGAYLVWASALLCLLFTGRYQTFLRPDFWALLLWALAVLLLFAAALFWARPSLPAGSMAAVPGIRLLVMLLPLIYVMADQEQTFGSFEQDTWVSVEGILGLKEVGDFT